MVAGGCSPKGGRNKATLALTKPVGESMCIRTHPIGVWTDVHIELWKRNRNSNSHPLFNLRQQLQLQHILKQFLAKIFFGYKSLLLWGTEKIVAASCCIRLFASRSVKSTVTTIYPENSPLVKGIVLSEIMTGLAFFIVHWNHLIHIIEFITLKVNRVINSMI